MKNIVTIGGGTGSYVVLSGIKNIPDISISAIVSMADDGGSTGVLREELDVLPPGDVRQCLVALSEHSDEVRTLMNYRFAEGSLRGHSFGNILLAALEKVTGNFSKGLEVISDILRIKGLVLPVTESSAKLKVVLENGREIEGENKINSSAFEAPVKEVSYLEHVEASASARKALEAADYIIVGPGNLYCSLLPPLKVDGFQAAIEQSRAKIIYIVNLVNKPGHTDAWRASDYLKVITTYLGRQPDFVVVNNHNPLISNDLKGPNIISDSLLSEEPVVKQEGDVIDRSPVRHDSGKIEKIISELIKK